MKKIAIILFFFFIHITVYSQVVNDDEIRIVATNFYKFLTRDDTTKSNVKIIKQDINKYKGITTYATIVFDNNDWVIISSDKSIDPILAFSDEGSYSDNINPNAQFWFDVYDYYIYNAKVLQIYDDEDKNKNYKELWNDLLNNDLVKYMQKSLGNNITPLITTKWGQSESNKGHDYSAYNYYSPSGQYANGNTCNQTHALAGCTAVAAGQIMRYWKYPDCNIFNWYDMPDKLKKKNSNPNYQTQKKEIANLLRNLADKMQDYMDYNNPHYYFSCNVSGTNTAEAILYPLKDDFFYPNAVLIKRDNYSSNWDITLYDELSNNRPILYVGYSYTDGHAFVCDGYRHVFKDKFRFNFGWLGKHDGYYKSVNPKGFFLNQMAIINIYPPVECNSSLTIIQTNKNLPFPLNEFLYFNPEAGTINSSPAPITIAQNEVVHYKAYNEIVLENFETEDGADFVAEIIPCPSSSTVDCSNFINYKNSTKSLLSNTNDSSNTGYNVQIYPNPSTGIYTISCNKKKINGSIHVYNYLGKLVLEENISKTNFLIDLSNQPNGIYLIKLNLESNIYTQKLIKK